MHTLKWLREAGVGVEQASGDPISSGTIKADALLEIAGGGVVVTFAAEQRRRAPYPNELPRLDARRQALSRDGQPLLVAPFVSETLGAALTAAGWSWADAQGNFDLRAPALLLRQRRATKPPRPARRRLPQGSGSLAIIRALIGFSKHEDEEQSATALANQAGVSQPRASQVLHQLHQLDLVERSPRGRWQPDPAALLDRLLAEYAGPGGSELHFYSLDSPTDVALAAAQAASSKHEIAVSADVGPDLILAWRRPSLVIIYARHEISAADLGLIESRGRHDANVIIRIPDDRSVFPVPHLSATVRDVEVPLADPSQMIWDLQELGGEDRLEAAGMLSQRLLKLP